MGLLEDLKKQADDMRSAEAKETARQAEQEAYYQVELRPAMQRALTYLDELIKHINFVQPERVVHYPFTPDKQELLPLKQSTYKLVIDSSASPRQVNIRVAAEFSEQPVFHISERKAVLFYAEYLDKYGLQYHRQDAIDRQHQMESATFTLEGPLQLAVRLQVDAEQQCIVVFLKNFGKPGVQRHQYRPEQINDELLDRLGRLLLHDVDSLVIPTELSDEVRQRIRDQLIEDKRREQALQQQVEADALREQEAVEAAKLNNRLKQTLRDKTQLFKKLYAKE